MNLLDLFVKISVDTSEVDKNLGDTKEKALSFGDVLKANIAGQAIVAGVKAVAGAVKNIGEAAIQSYGEYEQLAGGAQLMFGDAYDFIAEKAKNAYNTVQMSQNDYLQQVNGFATGLKTALGGNEQAAAELADRILNAEADVVAATGNSQEAVQNAFNGIMKSNYTMLDNLQLGITPTKEGFQEVIDKVNEWNEANGRATSYQIGNLADAQNALVDYIEMQGLSGYAANEAADTIQGSIASMKAAYDNFITGLGDENADMAKLITNLLGSTVTVAENLLPVVERILENIGVVVQEKGPEMIEKFVGYAVEKLPQVIELGLQMVIALVKGLAQNLPQLVTGVLNMAATIIKTLVDSIPDVIEVGKDIVRGVWDGIKAMGSWIKEKVSGFFGGIVDNVKGVLGIHSPSRVFAGIGENMALGLGEGWDNEYGTIKQGITRGLDFGTATVGFADSGIGRSSAAIVNSMGVSTETGTTTINLMFPDGTKLASYLLPFSIKAAAAAGTPIANAQMA